MPAQAPPLLRLSALATTSSPWVGHRRLRLEPWPIPRPSLVADWCAILTGRSRRRRPITGCPYGLVPLDSLPATLGMP